MLPSRQPANPDAGAILAGPWAKPRSWACAITATGTLPTAARGNAAASTWSRPAVEEALEEVAALLEGEDDQELVIRGVGEDGDIRLGLVEVETHASLREHRSWLKTGSPPPRTQLKVVLNLEIEGEHEEVREAANALLDELGAWIEVNVVTMSWL
jgi:hypothetical protein